jgi:hypothetical protein
LSSDERTLAVEGCHWAGPSEIKFFDFSNPRVLPFSELTQDVDSYYDKAYGWVEGGFKWSRGHDVFAPWDRSASSITLEELEQISKEFGDEDDELWKWVDDEIWIFHRTGDEMVGEKFEA